jgi:hypothetical protein
MAIRFTSFEAYKKLLADKQTGAVSGRAIFMGKFLLCLGGSKVNVPSRAKLAWQPVSLKLSPS